MREEFSDDYPDDGVGRGFKEQDHISTSNGENPLPIFSFKSAPIDLKNKNLPFIFIGVFLLYRWFS